MGGNFHCEIGATQRDSASAMKTLVRLSSLFCSVLATLSLAAGLDRVATKLDPVSHKAEAVSPFDLSALPPEPCVPCMVDPE